MQVVEEVNNGATPQVDSEKLASKRTDYYDKWNKFSNDSVSQVEKEEEEEARKAAEKLGLDKNVPRSEAEEKDLAKRQALKEAKKLWDDRKVVEEAARFSLSESDVDMHVDDSVLEGKRVIFFKNCKNSRFTLPENLSMRLVKVFIESCENCSFDLHAVTISQHVEVSHCSDCKINVKALTSILQVDLCKDIEIRYDNGVFDPKLHKIFHAGVSNSEFHVHHSEETVHSIQVDYQQDGAKEVGEKTKEEHQFVSHFDEGKFVTEPVYRSKGNMPLTKKQIEEAERLGDGDGLQTDERAAELKKIGGNEAFKDGEYAQAAIYYTEAIDLAPKDSPMIPVCYSNRAYSYLKIGHLPEALADASKAVELDPKYVKGLFRKGLALHALKRYGDAGQVLTQALDLEPKNQQIKQALQFAEVNFRKQQRQ